MCLRVCGVSFKNCLSLFALVCDCARGGPSVLGFDHIPWWGILLISLGFSLLTAIVVWFIVCPHLKKKIERKFQLGLSQLPHNMSFFVIFF